MRWYRLTEEERRVLRAPAEIDGLGMLALTLFNRWQRDAVFVLVSAFVDESGTGGNPKVMLAALVARVHRWHGFNKHWKRLLDKEEIEFSHLVAMENKNPPFEDWGMARTVPFVRRGRKRIEKNCDFGLTAAVNIEDHRVHYCDKMPSNVPKDSPYGVCARSIIEGVTYHAAKRYGPTTCVNFIWENSQHFNGVHKIFDDLKAHVPEVASSLGTITPAEKHEFGALMAADMMASLGRRYEPEAKFVSIPVGMTLPAEHEGFCTYHVDLHAEALERSRRQSEEIAREKRWAAKKRRAERKGR